MAQTRVVNLAAMSKVELRTLLGEVLDALEARRAPEVAPAMRPSYSQPGEGPLRLDPNDRPERRMGESPTGIHIRLSWERVELARRLWLQGWTQEKIGRWLGADVGTIAAALLNKTWRVPEDEVWWRRLEKAPLL